MKALSFLKDHPFVDLIIRGEGEKSVQKLIETYLEKGYPADGQEDSFTGLKGINYRNTSGDIINTFDEPLIETLDIIPFPYESLEGLDNRILYYESSRGCPFDCQYCLSSTIKGVRFFSLDRVKKDLSFFVDHKVMQVKFIDRTFNADKKRSLEIFKYLHEIDNGYTNFHFEITADRLDEETVDFLKCVRPGLFQF